MEMVIKIAPYAVGAASGALFLWLGIPASLLLVICILSYMVWDTVEKKRMEDVLEALKDKAVKEALAAHLDAVTEEKKA